jgi:hypothetical protein
MMRLRERVRGCNVETTYQDKIKMNKIKMSEGGSLLIPEFPLGFASAVGRFGRIFRAILYRRIPDTPTNMSRKLHPKSPRHHFAP